MAQDVEALAQFVATTRFEDIPAPVVAHARRILLDIDDTEDRVHGGQQTGAVERALR